MNSIQRINQLKELTIEKLKKVRTPNCHRFDHLGLKAYTIDLDLYLFKDNNNIKLKYDEVIVLKDIIQQYITAIDSVTV